MRHLLEYRLVVSLAGSALVGLAGLHALPFPATNVFLALIRTEQPAIYAAFSYGYATLWLSTPFLMLSGGFSLVYIFAARWDRPVRSQSLPPYLAPETRDDLFVVLGERHRQTSPQRAAAPTWLTIPERGLYTGMLIVGAIGSGKTSGCMYPYVEQLLGYRAPSTYFLRKAQQQDPEQRSGRARRDEELRPEIRRVWNEHQQVYGPRKVWRQLRREVVRVARCTVERLMREMSLRRAVRGRAWKITTQADPAAARPADLVERRFTATRPNQLWVADFTYVATWRGFVYVAFVIDVFARRLVGWSVAGIRTSSHANHGRGRWLETTLQ